MPINPFPDILMQPLFNFYHHACICHVLELHINAVSSPLNRFNMSLQSNMLPVSVCSFLLLSSSLYIIYAVHNITYALYNNNNNVYMYNQILFIPFHVDGKLGYL